MVPCVMGKIEQYKVLSKVILCLSQLMNIKPWCYIKTCFNGTYKHNNLNIFEGEYDQLKAYETLVEIVTSPWWALGTSLISMVS